MNDAIANAWGLRAADLRAVDGGLINQTWVAGERLVIQRLHPVFAAEVNIDIDAVTRHAAARIEVPRVVPTTDGALWLEHDGGVYRALSFVAGVTIHRIDDPRRAHAAGYTAGAFHRAVDDLEHEYRFARAGVHDTAAHLARLATCEATRDEPADAARLASEILDEADELPPLPVTQPRHCHGDLKISNIRFPAGEPGPPGVLIDLDTVGYSTIAYELGDALRSWCNPRGEDIERPEVDLDILEQAMRGYAAGAAGLLDADEIASIAPGLATVALELAARFCVDAFEDRYFGWDASRFASRVEHNLVRARGQLSLARSALRHLDEATQRIDDAFTAE